MLQKRFCEARASSLGLALVECRMAAGYLSFGLNVPSFLSAVSAGERVESSVRSFSGYDWVVQLYPRGRGACNSGRGTHTSVYLRCCGPTDAGMSGRTSRKRRREDGWETAGNFRADFSVVSNTKRRYCRLTPFLTFSRKLNRSGILAHFPLEGLQGEDSLLKKDGSIDVDVRIERQGDCDSAGEESCGDDFGMSAASLLDDPEQSYADVRISGNDGGVPIRAHRAILGYRVKYFRELFELQDDAPQQQPASGNASVITVDDLTTELLRVLIRRVYGDPFPESWSDEKELASLLEIWDFTTARHIYGLPAECVVLLKAALSPGTFAPCFRMAVRLDDGKMQTFLAARMMAFKTLSQDALDTFAVGDIRALVARAPPVLEALEWADAWVKCEEERASHGAEVLKAFPLDKLARSKYSELAALDIAKYASPESLLQLLGKF